MLTSKLIVSCVVPCLKYPH